MRPSPHAARAPLLKQVRGHGTAFVERAQPRLNPPHRSNMSNLKPQFFMGQYFKVVNTDKKEVVNPWDLGGVAKFFEWVYNPQTRIFPWLLRRSDEGGGGDITDPEDYGTLGRWAGDRITLIGDYDSSKLYEQAAVKDANGKQRTDAEYTDISELLRREFNKAVTRDGYPNARL